MEHEHKLQAVAICQGVHPGTERMVDRFSDLPDQVAHHILSFLAITDLTRFGCVSNRCNELCLSTPTLNFDEFSPNNTVMCYPRLNLLSYLDRFFFHRGNNKIQCFRFRWNKHNKEDEEAPCLCICETFRMFTWIENAVRCNVEKLDIEMNFFDFEEEPFPSCVFLCASLKSLAVNMNLITLKTPSCAFSSNLKHLDLRNVYIKDAGFFKWISCFCNCLEELILEQVHGTKSITIESSSLKMINVFACRLIGMCCIDIAGEKLDDILIVWTFDSPSNKSLNINAPNLKSLKWAGHLMDSPILGKFECLNNSVILLELEMDNLEKLFEALCSLCSASFLFLGEVAIKALFREGPRKAPTYGASSLRLRIGSLTDELVPALVSLFRLMPKLCNLVIESKSPPDASESNAFGFNVEYWKLQNLVFIHRLKLVTIALCIGCNGIELAKYLLQSAPKLQSMVIICLPEEKDKVTTKLNECKKMSNATVVIQEK